MSQTTHVPRNEAVIEPKGNAFSRVWFTFFQTISRKLEGIETITAATPSITSADAATQAALTTRPMCRPLRHWRMN